MKQKEIFENNEERATGRETPQSSVRRISIVDAFLLWVQDGTIVFVSGMIKVVHIRITCFTSPRLELIGSMTEGLANTSDTSKLVASGTPDEGDDVVRCRSDVVDAHGEGGVDQGRAHHQED